MRGDPCFLEFCFVLFGLRCRPGGVPPSSSSYDFSGEFLSPQNTKVSTKTVKRRGICCSFCRSAIRRSICPIRGLLLLLSLVSPPDRSRPLWTLPDRRDRNLGTDRKQGSFRECSTPIDRESLALSIGVRIIPSRRSVLSHFLFSTLRVVDRRVSPRVGLVSKTESGAKLPQQLNENVSDTSLCVVFHADHGGDRIFVICESWGIFGHFLSVTSVDF